MNIFGRKKPAEATHKIFNLIILDESGSMSSIRKATIEGLQGIFATIRDGMEQFPDQDHSVSLISFSGSDIKEILWKAPVNKIPKGFENKYRPGGGTPLYDAIGSSLKKLSNTVAGLSSDSYNVLVTILTDGEENSSTKYSYSQVKALIDELQTGPWTFAFIGAGLDAYEVASSLSIKNAMTFEPSESGLESLFEKTRSANMRFMRVLNYQQTSNIDESSFKENFFDDNQPQ